MTSRKNRPSTRRNMRCLTAAALMTLGASPLFAQVQSKQVMDNPAIASQINALLHERDMRTGPQRKLGSHLWYALQASRGKALPGVDTVYANAANSIQRNAAGAARVKITGTPSDTLLKSIAAAGGSIRYSSAKSGIISANIPLAALEGLAASPDVRRIVAAAPARTNVGALTSQGYISHKANLVVNAGHDGSGVRVGVLSDSIESLNALIASGDLPNVTVITDKDGLLQDGAGLGGHSEGTAMMEIVHDLAPGAQLFYATAYNGEESFADNIRMLRDVYHCDIIVDDISYFDEPVFQDGDIAQAVNDVTASGALYFSAAANSGNLTSGTSGTWEGDFNPPAQAAAPGTYQFHQFSGTQPFNVLLAGSPWIGLHWSDPWANATNNYDLFLVSADGTKVLCASVDAQTGAGSFPLEACYAGDGKTWPNNTLIMIGTNTNAAPRALHVDTERGLLSIGTSGATFGHNAGRNTVSMAAVYWNSAKTGTRAFVGGAANPTEVFSSDGPRKVFFQPDGTPITPDNFLFATQGGETLNKPELAAADGVSAKTPGFNPFYGTSAAAPHAAAVAALIKSARPDYTNAQILAALKATALDIRAPGVDRDAGYGLIMAQEAVNYALTH